MALDALMGTVKSVDLTQEARPSVRASFEERPNGAQYQALMVDFKTFLDDAIEESILATPQERGLYGFPCIHFKRSSQPDSEGYRMEGAYPNAVQIRPFSSKDVDVMPDYANHLRQVLDISE